MPEPPDSPAVLTRNIVVRSPVMEPRIEIMTAATIALATFVVLAAGFA